MRVRDDENLAVDQLPGGPVPLELTELHPQEAGARALDPVVPQISARTAALFTELGEIDVRLASLPIEEAKLLAQARSRVKRATKEIATAENRLVGTLPPNQAANERGRIKQAERDLMRERARERELSLVVESRGGWEQEAERLSSRQAKLGPRDRHGTGSPHRGVGCRATRASRRGDRNAAALADHAKDLGAGGKGDRELPLRQPDHLSRAAGRSPPCRATASQVQVRGVRDGAGTARARA